MKTKSIHCLIALVLSASAHAQPPERGDRRPPPVPPCFAALDADGDGVLSEAEITAAPEALRALDKNNDGELTLKELRPEGRPPRDERRGRGPKGPPPRGDDAAAE